MTDVPPREDAVTPNGRTWLRIRRCAFSLGNQVVGAVVTAISLSFAYMIFNDFIAPPPDLSGSWKFTVIYEDTALNKYKDLQVTYQVLLAQEGLDLSGHGEKLSERGPKQDAVDYVGDDRTNIKVSGIITRNYLSHDTLQLQYSEGGLRRDSATIQRLIPCGTGMLCGCFRSTIADTTGPVWWQHRGKLDSIYEPVELPELCYSTDCLNDIVRCE